jgi:alpha,alpha-trehalase
MALPSTQGTRPLPSALDRLEEVRRAIEGRCVALFLDYDGTLTPIVAHPSQALLADATRSLLRELAERCTVAVISGRDLDDVRGHVGLDGVFYAGSHGFQMAGPKGWRSDYEEAVRVLPALDAAEHELREVVPAVRGAWVERKRFAVAAHYRQVNDADVPALEAIVARVAKGASGLRRSGGKRVFELRPAIDWDKGAVVRSLLERLGLEDGGLPLYIGDDLTDEDGFRAVSESGIGIVVGSAQETAARYALADPAEVVRFLDALLAEIE